MELATQPKSVLMIYVSAYRLNFQVEGGLLAHRAKPGCSEISPTVLTLEAVS